MSNQQQNRMESRMEKNVENGHRTTICHNLSDQQKQNEKRTNCLSWDEYFMAVAFLSAQRSKDPRTQVGACIVNESNRIVGIGYNGMPIGCSDDDFPWGRDSDDILERKYLYVCHAELNAVMNKNAADVHKARIYVCLFPCNECSKVIIQSGISEIIYYSDKYAEKPEFIAARKLLTAAGVKLRKFQSERHQILLDFDIIDRKTDVEDAMPVMEYKMTHASISSDRTKLTQQ